MEKTIKATFKLRGTEKEIYRVKAQIASLSSLEEVISLYIKEGTGKYIHRNAPVTD